MERVPLNLLIKNVKYCALSNQQANIERSGYTYIIYMYVKYQGTIVL